MADLGMWCWLGKAYLPCAQTAILNYVKNCRICSTAKSGVFEVWGFRVSFKHCSSLFVLWNIRRLCLQRPRFSTCREVQWGDPEAEESCRHILKKNKAECNSHLVCVKHEMLASEVPTWTIESSLANSFARPEVCYYLRGALWTSDERLGECIWIAVFC